MVQQSEITFQLYTSGYCTAHSKIVNPKAQMGTRKFYASWGLLKHPLFGNMLFDCGYNELFQKETKHLPELLYRLITPVFVKEEETAKYILKEKGIEPEDINYIIVSHFHADHICALKDFPKARFICNQSSVEEFRSVSGFAAVQKGIIKKLVPDDFESRMIILQDISTSYIDEKSGLKFFRFFNQDVFQLAELPGHARGMLGLKVDLPDKKLLYATDAGWSIDAFNKNILPMRIVTLFFDSWKKYTHTITTLKKFEISYPEFNILFTHCPETLTYIENNV